MKRLGYSVVGVAAVGLLAGVVAWAQPRPDPQPQRFPVGSSFIQRQINALPRSDGMAHGSPAFGGVIELPAGIFELDVPLRLFGGVTLRGQGIATVLRYSGKEPAAIIVGSDATHGYTNSIRIEDLCIWTATSQGIAFDPKTAKGEASDIALRHLVLSTGATSINLRLPSEKASTYQIQIDDVRCVELGGAAIDLNGRILSVNALRVQGQRENYKPPAAVCVFEGHGKIDGSWFEGAWKTPMILMKGAWSMRGNWMEYYGPEKGEECQMILDEVRLDIDRFMFAQPKQYVTARNSYITVLSDLGAERPLDRSIRMEKTQLQMLLKQ